MSPVAFKLDCLGTDVSVWARLVSGGTSLEAKNSTGHGGGGGGAVSRTQVPAENMAIAASVLNQSLTCVHPRSVDTFYI